MKVRGAGTDVTQYLIKWLGYTEEHNTWKPPSNLNNTQEVITLFHQKHPSAP